MPINREGYLTTKEVQQYIKEKYNMHWNRFYVYTLLSRKCFTAEKLGHINLYKKTDIDEYIMNLGNRARNRKE